MTQKDDKWSEMRALVVDDSRFSRSIMRNLLAMIGITRVIEAESAETGLMLVRDRVPDFVILDWVMPGLSGDEFLVSLRSEGSPELKYIPVLVATAEANKKNVIRAARLGANGVLCKPFSAELLRQRLAYALENQFALLTPPAKRRKSYVTLPPMPSAAPNYGPASQAPSPPKVRPERPEPQEEETILLL
ncbi:response regulator [Coralliovum pocilloporae]|uniref:response regulator n=1 Tax=Coralliovum pocilloporae TaxID=3066369 RepID=UPI003307537C